MELPEAQFLLCLNLLLRKTQRLQHHQHLSNLLPLRYMSLMF